MRVVMPGVLVVGLMVAASAAAMAQQGPLVVPIVGSPAAQQQQQPTPAMPPIMQAPASQPVMGAAPTARKLQLSFNKGAVNLVAQNVTVREILGEWQRQNGCQFVNADKLSGGMVSFEFGQEPELHVIAALLRGAAGYIVAPRSDTAQSGSVCGSVYILPTSRPTSTASSYTPGISSPLAAPLMQPGNPDDEIPPVSMPMGPQQIMRPVPNQPPVGAQPGQPAPGGFGPVPIGTTPGVGRIGGPAGPPIIIPPPFVPMPTGPGRGGGG